MKMKIIDASFVSKVELDLLVDCQFLSENERFSLLLLNHCEEAAVFLKSSRIYWMIINFV